MISIHHHMQARYPIIIMGFTHPSMVSFHHFIYPCMASFTPFHFPVWHHSCHFISLYGIIPAISFIPIWHPFAIYPYMASFRHLSLYDITASSYPFIVESCCHPILSGWHQQYHILPHHSGESHPAPSLRGIIHHSNWV
jgi:hypothetical protein